MGTVFEIQKILGQNQVVSAFRIDNKTYTKLKDISGGTAGTIKGDGSLISPAAASRLGQEAQFSALQKLSDISIAEIKIKVK